MFAVALGVEVALPKMTPSGGERSIRSRDSPNPRGRNGRGMAEEWQRTVRQLVDVREAIERLKDITSVLFQLGGKAKTVAIDVVAVGKIAEMFLDITPHLAMLRALTETMIDQIVKVHGAQYADPEFADLKAALEVLKTLTDGERFCSCGQCATKPETERMPAGTVAH